LPNVTDSSQQAAADRLTPLQVVTLILSVYVLTALVMQITVPLTRDTVQILDRIDFFVCLVFLTDFFVRLRQAESKRQFLRWGWIDFVSSIPMLDIFRVGRVVRIVRLFRILRAFRSTKNLVTFLLHRRKATSFAAATTICFVVMVFAAIAVLNFEDTADGNIKSAGDAFWWAFVTMTTVGYGDKYPVTWEGRMVACILMTAGAGLFATSTAFIAAMFLHPESKEAESELKALAREVRSLHAKIDKLGGGDATGEVTESVDRT
jgi:voltage-gated potassium channel